jgi:nitroreductase
MLNDRSSPLALLASRRSCRPRDLIDPGPDSAQLRQMLEIASRVPDHGKLAPWRFVVVPPRHRAAFGDMLEAAYRAGRPDPGRLEIEAVHRFATQAPTLVIILSSPAESAKIPAWEQELSAGAAAMNLVHAAIASGFDAGWVTGWAAYSPQVLDGIGAGPGEKIAGFIFIGTSGVELEERARPSLDQIAREWSPVK